MDNIRKLIETNNKSIHEHHCLINQLEQHNRELQKQINLLIREEKFGASLNDHQKAVVYDTKTHGNSIVIACPGSGKTHTLVAKVAYLINERNMDPGSILLITFTKKAAQEMVTRLKSQTTNNRLLHIGTIHGLAYRTLQKYQKINYTILDDIDQSKALREQIKLVVDNGKNKELSVDEKTTLVKILQKNEVPLSEMVIICRKNRQLDHFELELIKNQINYWAV